MTGKAYIVGVGMTKSEKPGTREWQYWDIAEEAGGAALADAGVAYEQVEQVPVGGEPLRRPDLQGPPARRHRAGPGRRADLAAAGRGGCPAGTDWRSGFTGARRRRTEEPESLARS